MWSVKASVAIEMVLRFFQSFQSALTVLSIYRSD